MPNLTVLNVAEKNDAAKRLSQIMSNGNSNRREGYSKFNKIFEFEYDILNSHCKMIMTSVSGHLMDHAFVRGYQKWTQCNPVALFEAPIDHQVPEKSNDIKRTLHREVRKCQVLIIWTDGDREGENIGFEIIKVCQEIKPNIRLHRARFSEITPRAINIATQNLVAPDENVSNAVMIRQELDLRIGAAFTRFQTLRLQKRFPEMLSNQVISYGSCQFPTLGFVVERYQQVQEFIPETFYKLRVIHKKDNIDAEFSWQRGRLFNQRVCALFCAMCQETPNAKVVKVTSKPKSKWRPLPLDTVELEKTASKKLRINAKETMTIAEKLYNKGIISYPRTETNIFPKGMNLATLVENQSQSQEWGAFATGILQSGGPNPRQGKKTDNAHPPIHPIKYTDNLDGNERRVYEFIVRHFLACLSLDAQGQETTVEIEIAGEYFTTHGLIIIERNYLEVYIYEGWSSKNIPNYAQGETFVPDSIDMNSGETQAPPLLSESDLITLMEKHGIGTDATHADHIEKIKDRQYVGVQNDGTFLPGKLGMGLVEGYDAMGFAMSKPHLRAGLEADLKQICEGRKDKDIVLADQIKNYKEVFQQAVIQVEKLDNALCPYFGAMADIPDDEEDTVSEPIRKCPKCGVSDMVLRKTREGDWLLGCMNYPDCRNSIFFPKFVTNVTKSDSICMRCKPPPVHKLVFVFKRGSVPPMMMSPYTSCIGCDDMLLGLIGGGSGSSSHTVRNPTGQSNRNNRPPPPPSRTHSNDNPTRTRKKKPKDSKSDTLPKTKTRKGPPDTRGMDGTNQQGLHQIGTGPLEDDADIKCKCLAPAVMRTVGKDGPNKGRQFYSCFKPRDESCGFFQWADENNQDNRGSSSNSFGNTSFSRPNISSNKQSGSRTFAPSNSSNLADVSCKCNTPAVTRTVNKEGPNKGRQFYTCPKPMGQGCGFFEWTDENNQGGSSNNTFGNNSFSRQNSSFQQRGSSNNAPSNSFGSSDIRCKCNTPAVMRTVNKEGPNKGRQFYACPKPMGEGCGFFEWSDENNQGGSSNNSFGNNSFNRNNNSYTARNASSSTDICCNCGTPATSRTVRKEGPNKGRQFYSCVKTMDDCGFFQWNDDNQSNAGNKSKKRKCGKCGEVGHDRRACPY